MVQTAGHVAFREHFIAVLAAVCGTDGGSCCHFSCTFQRAVIVALRGAESLHGNCIYLFLSLNVVYMSTYVRQECVVGMIKQTSDSKEVDTAIC